MMFSDPPSGNAIPIQRSSNSLQEREAEPSTMEMVELTTDLESQPVSMSTSVENDEQVIRALIYTTCYNVLDG